MFYRRGIIKFGERNVLGKRRGGKGGRPWKRKPREEIRESEIREGEGEC